MERRKFLRDATCVYFGLLAYLNTACRSDGVGPRFVKAQVQESDVWPDSLAYAIMSDGRVYKVGGQVDGVSERLVRYDDSNREAIFIITFSESKAVDNITKPNDQSIFLIDNRTDVSLGTLIDVYGKDPSDSYVISGEIAKISNTQVRAVFRNVRPNGEYELFFANKFFGSSQRADSLGEVEPLTYKFIVPKYD